MHAIQLKWQSQSPIFIFIFILFALKLGSVKKSNAIVAFSVYLTFSKSDVSQFVEFDISSLFYKKKKLIILFMFVLFCSFLFYKQLIRPAVTSRLYSKCRRKRETELREV